MLVKSVRNVGYVFTGKSIDSFSHAQAVCAQHDSRGARQGWEEQPVIAPRDVV